MRKGWEYKKLGEVCTIKAGYTPPKDELFDNGAYPYYKVADMNTLGNDVYLDITSSYKIDANKLFPKGAIVFPKNGAAVSTNKKRILKYDSIVDLNTGVAIFQKGINEKFAYYWFIDTDFKKYVRGGALPTLDIKSLKNKPFPCIEKSTQLAIVSELDKINELIRLKKEQLKDFNNLAQSLFYEMFGDPVENEKGWEVKKLGEIGEFKNGLNFSKDENGHSIKFLGVSDFQNKKSIASDQLDCISLSECVQEDYLLKTGDIVFVRSNGKKELIGRSVKMYITAPTTYSGFCIRCRITDEKVDKDYIAILLKTPIIRQLMTNSGRGCNISNLNQKVLNSIPIILPPLPLQRLFAQRIEQIEREKSEVQKSIQDLETLLASRMQYWFE